MKTIFLLASLWLDFTWGATDQVLCGWSDKNLYTTAPGDLKAQIVDAKLCTSILYGGLELNSKGNVIQVADDEDINAVIELKKQNKNLKVILSVSGKSDHYSTVAANSQLTQSMVKEIINYVSRFEVDGVDINWRSPEEKDKNNFVSFLKALKTSLTQAKLILYVAVYGFGADKTAKIYDVPGIFRHADLVNIQAYDFRTPSNFKYTFATSALMPYDEQTAIREELDRELNVAYLIAAWIKLGASLSRATLAIPAFVRTWTLNNKNRHGFFAPADNPGTAGKYTKTLGLLSRSELCSLSGYTKIADNATLATYQYSKNQWLTYDTFETAGEKVILAKRLKMSGVMLAYLDLDDVYGACKSNPFPVLNMINIVMYRQT